MVKFKTTSCFYFLEAIIQVAFIQSHPTSNTNSSRKNKIQVTNLVVNEHSKYKHGREQHNEKELREKELPLRDTNKSYQCKDIKQKKNQTKKSDYESVNNNLVTYRFFFIKIFVKSLCNKKFQKKVKKK